MGLPVNGHCPSCGRDGTLAAGVLDGIIACQAPDCPVPDSVTRLLADGETGHIVVLREDDFAMQHPLRERIGQQLFECSLDEWLTSLPGPPQEPGKWRVSARDEGGWAWERLGDEPPGG